jgi:hypothetical protein
MLTVVREIASTSNPAALSRSAALRTSPSSEAKAIAESDVIAACISNIDVPPSERGEACANTVAGRPLESFFGATSAPAVLPLPRAACRRRWTGFLAAGFFVVRLRELGTTPPPPAGARRS